MSKSDAEEFNVALAKIKLNGDYEETVKEFESLCSRYEKKYPAYIKMLKGNIEKYLCYKKYPEGLQKHIYRTNIVENINSRFEVLRVNAGGYFHSIKTAEI